ncbi:hypothetical protein RJ641_014432 [Dillenia turbinata]|uniref:Uncharacterized protein n=1 Tax=Dillenia turbinata TaxID=194707 RepID=A0AAN8UU91_9MAGN
MAFLRNKSQLPFCLRSSSQDPLQLSRRGFHIEPGVREKALLAEDPSLARFKSYKKSVWKLKRVGDVLTIVVVAGCCYEIYVKATMREEARKQANTADRLMAPLDRSSPSAKDSTWPSLAVHRLRTKKGKMLKSPVITFVAIKVSLKNNNFHLC